MSKFTIPNINIAGAPTIDWRFDGSLGLAEVAGARAEAEAVNEESAVVRIRDATDKLLADVLVRKLPSDESITVSVMNVGSALLWSHLRWSEASAAPKESTEVGAP